MRDQQLRMLTLAQRGQADYPFPTPRGRPAKSVFQALKDPLSLTPDVAVHMDVLAAAVREHQIGTFAFGDDAAAMQAQRLRRMFADQTDSLRQRESVVVAIGDAESGIKQAGGVVVGRENIQQAAGGQLMRGDIAGMRAAAHEYSAPPSTHSFRAGAKPARRPT